MSDDLDALLDEASDDELWLISYADLLTLLIAFFVLLIASSPVQVSQLERIASSFRGAEASPLGALRARVDGVVARAELTGKVRTVEDAEGLAIELKDALLFASGSADIRPEGARLIAEVAGLVKDLPGREVVVEGHSDELPIHTSRFASNWELSAQRAINVLRALEAAGIERERLSVRSYADTHALDIEGTLEQRRAAKRRVVIRVK